MSAERRVVGWIVAALAAFAAGYGLGAATDDGPESAQIKPARIGAARFELAPQTRDLLKARSVPAAAEEYAIEPD